MTELDRIKQIQQQCQRVANWILEAEKANDPAAAVKLYNKARDQMAKVTESVRVNIGQMEMFSAG